jgi:hypothetical protein
MIILSSSRFGVSAALSVEDVIVFDPLPGDPITGSAAHRFTLISEAVQIP